MTNITPYSTRITPSDDDIASALAASPLGPLPDTGSPVTRELARDLALVWRAFTRRLDQIPVIAAIQSETITRDQYLTLLRNWRQQVVEGGRWIAQTSASMSLPLFAVRSMLVGHAAEEHRDYQMIDKNYAAAGGDVHDIEQAPKNVGSEALSSYVFHQASLPDPLHLFGAMFIIEGIGTARMGVWADKIARALSLPSAAVSFLAYHGKHDDGHYDKLRSVLTSPFVDAQVARALVKTARVVGRLYCLQFEELDHV